MVRPNECTNLYNIWNIILFGDSDRSHNVKNDDNNNNWNNDDKQI